MNYYLPIKNAHLESDLRQIRTESAAIRHHRPAIPAVVSTFRSMWWPGRHSW